jgi:hypothetical protein
MTSGCKIVLSASRRTDIPAFYMNWFMSCVRSRYFETVNPYSRKLRKVSASPDHVHTIVFWSKNFGPFLDGNYGEILLDMGYHLFFNFTINSHCPDLEPGVPPLDQRLGQMKALCSRFSPACIHWRLDPICYYIDEQGREADNLEDFGKIADACAQVGIARCITSFMDHYPKIRRRIQGSRHVFFLDPPLEKKQETLLQIRQHLAVRNISLSACCEKALLETLPASAGIPPSSCIPNHLLLELYGGNISTQPDRGQRRQSGCDCRVSTDIGSYTGHPCFHNCLFCYANPSPRFAETSP